MRVGKELLDRFEIEDKSTLAPKKNSQKYLTRAYEHSVFAEAIARICK